MSVFLASALEYAARVSSPAGGLHRNYRNPWRVPGTTKELGPFISVRGVGDYVIAPPTTTTDGAYIALITAPVAPLPDWLAQLLADPIPRPRSKP